MDRLIGWKEIADAIGVSIRSAQYFNRKRPMPIKKFEGRPSAKPEDLEKWLEKCPDYNCSSEGMDV